MTLSTVRRYLPLLAVALGGALAACGGGGGGGSHALPAAAGAGGPSVPVNIALRFSQPAAFARRPQYVGAGTQAITVAVSGASPVPFSCTAPGCNVSVDAPAGTDAFTVDAYDGPNLAASPAPNLISRGSATATIALNATNTLNLALGAVIGSGALRLTVTNRLPLEGTPASTSLQLAPGTLTDPDGNAIGTGALLAPLTIEPSPASSHVSVSPATITSAATPVTVSYDGAASGPVNLVAVQNVTGAVVSSSAAPLTIVSHAYFVFVPSYKAGCPNTSSDCLRIWSPILDAVVGNVQVGNGANDVAVNAALTQAYVANSVDGTISIVDISDKESPQALSTIGGLTNASGIGYDVTHGRNLLYTASPTSLAPPSQLFAVSPSGTGLQSLEAAHIYLGSAVLDPTGNCLYSPVYGQNQIGYGDDTGFDVYDLVNAVDRGYTASESTSHVVVAPNGATVYALQTDGGTPADVTAFPVTNPGCATGTGTTVSPGVSNGKGLAISPDGSTLYVGGAGGNPALSAIATSPFAVSGNYTIGSGLPIFGMAVGLEGRYLHVTDNYGEANTARFHVIDLQAAGGPAEIAGSPFFTNANNVRVFP